MASIGRRFELHRLYVSTIDLGAHPNQWGVVLGLRKSSAPDERTYHVGILNPEPLLIAFAARMLLAMSIGTLKIFQRMFPERFKIMNIDQRIDRLIELVNTVFKKYRNQIAGTSTKMIGTDDKGIIEYKQS
jgi:ribosomal protein S17E